MLPYITRNIVCRNTTLKTYSILAQTMAANKVEVTHLPDEKRFVAKIGDAKEQALLDYEIIDDKTWDLQHTLVPEIFRGQGVGKVLAKAAFDHIIKENLQMRLTCWYLKMYADKNPLPEYKERIVD